MNNITKKIVAIAMVLGMVGMILPSSAQALTAAELQATIDSLLAQIATLQSQLTAVQGGTSTAAPAVCSGITFSRSLTLTMTGTDVKCLQAILNQAPSTQIAASGVGSAGNETTYFGNLTKVAVAKFQVKYAADCLTPLGLTAGTGFVGAKTIAKLNSVLTASVLPAGVVCGNGTCETGETTANCLADCPAAVLPTAAGLTVSMAADTSVAATIISDGATNVAGSQALIPFLKVNFSTPSGTTAKVTTLKLKRIGVSSDTDIPAAYLYDGDTKLAEMTSLSSGVVTFLNAAGLFTVSGTKTITVKADLQQDVTAGKTIGFGIAAATDIVTDASAVNGTFAMNGNLMTTAVVTDFGRANIATSTNSAVVDPGLTGFEAFRLTITSSNQKIKLYSIKLLQLGSIQKTDISNLSLWAGGTQLGSTVASLAADNTVTFDLSSAPYEIPSGVARTLALKVDVIGGSTRTIRFSLQRSTDVVVTDANYGVSIRPDTTGIATFTVLDSTASVVGAGNLIISRRTDSPSGSVALNASNITLAKFDVKAVGEDIKVSNLGVAVASTGASTWSSIRNVQIFFDGTQIGTTQAILNTTTTVTLSFTVPVGQTKILEIKSDIRGDTTAGTGFSATSTLQAWFEQGVNNAQRQTSLGAFNFPAADQSGIALAVTAAGLSASRNSSVGSIQTVFNVQGVTIGSYMLTAGAAEGVDVSSLTFRDATWSANGAANINSLGAAFTNLKLYYGSIQLGSTVVPNTADPITTTYTFYPSGFSLTAGQTASLTLKGDVLAAPTWTALDGTCLIGAEGTGKVTTNAANIIASSGVLGQAITLSGRGVLSIALDSSSPEAAITSMGKTDVTLGVWKLSANSIEDITLSQILLLSNGNTTSSGDVTNLKLYCGTTQFGSAVDALVTPTLGGVVTGAMYAGFGGATCVIPKGSYKLITLKADIPAYSSGPYGTGGAGYYTDRNDFIQFYITTIAAGITGVATDPIIARGAGLYASTTVGSSSAAIAYPFRTSLTAAIACPSAGCGGATGQKTRAVSDKIANITLSAIGDTDAQLRAALVLNDDSVAIHTDWATSGTSTVALYATTTTFLDDANAILWQIGSTTGRAGSAASTTDYIVLRVATGTANSLNQYSRISFWVNLESKIDAIPTTTFFIADSTSTDRAYSASIATTSFTIYASSTWVAVDLSLTSSTAGVIATSGSAYIGFALDGVVTSTQLAIDAIRLYNDSVTVNISGNTTSTATSTGLLFTLQTTGGTEKARGRLNRTGAVVLTPTTEISVGATGVTYELVGNTTALMLPDTTSVETLNLSLTLGTVITPGNFRWYDQAVSPVKPITWLNGASPISVSLGY